MRNGKIREKKSKKFHTRFGYYVGSLFKILAQANPKILSRSVGKLVNIIFGFINTILFGSFIFGVNFTPKIAGYKNCDFDPISTQIAMMDIILTCVSVALAVAGFIGYGAIKSSAETKAIEAAKNEANRMMADFIKQETDKRAEFSSPSSINKKEAEVNAQAAESADKTL